MTVNQLIEWLRKEFPQTSWFESSLFGKKCAASDLDRSARIYVSAKKDKFGVDLDMKNNGFGRQLESLEEVKQTIIESMNVVNPKLLNSIQERLI